MNTQVKPMTGYHMLMILVGFFAVVFVVNFYMAYLAVSTFTGTVVDNSYVASQRFNGWLVEARTEKALGWQAAVSLDVSRHLIVRVNNKAGHPLAPLDGSGFAGRALVNEKPSVIHFVPVGAGQLQSVSPLPPGRWLLKLEMVSGTHHLHMAQEVR
jgi:nitrogen fixation protein FixH